MHDNYLSQFVGANTTQARKRTRKTKTSWNTILFQYLSSYSPYDTVPFGSFSNLTDKNSRFLSETGKTCKQVLVSRNEKKNVIFFVKGNDLTKVYIKLLNLLILFIGAINNCTTITRPVFVQGYLDLH